MSVRRLRWYRPSDLRRGAVGVGVGAADGVGVWDGSDSEPDSSEPDSSEESEIASSSMGMVVSCGCWGGLLELSLSEEEALSSSACFVFFVAGCWASLGTIVSVVGCCFDFFILRFTMIAS